MDYLTDVNLCKTVTDKYPDYFTFEEEEWFSNPLNYALIQQDNIGFAEFKGPGVYWLHFCFNSARGREAINLTKEMVAKLCEDRPVKLAVGLIELNNRKARWLIRQVGFKSLGKTETKNGLCEMFYTTPMKEEK